MNDHGGDTLVVIQTELAHACLLKDAADGQGNPGPVQTVRSYQKAQKPPDLDVLIRLKLLPPRK